MKNLFFVFCFLFVSIFSDVPMQKIKQELTQAEKDYQTAKKMFNPWYGGPLLTGSGNVMEPGYVNINPSIQITDNYAAFNKNRKSHSITDFIQVNPVLSLGLGLIKRFDATLNVQMFYQSEGSKKSNQIGDTSLKIAFAILKESPYIPALKISVKEIFPTGKYKNLTHYKATVQATGSGSYVTEFGIGISKIVWWWLVHPMQLRLSLNYGVPAKTKVKNFNTYGGGFGTDGKVSPGNYFIGSFGYEFSVIQKVVLALDVAYEYFNKSPFKGVNGVDKDGNTAFSKFPSSDNLSLAPAIEYVFTPDIALICGVWFRVYGRNTFNFAAGIINFSYGF